VLALPQAEPWQDGWLAGTDPGHAVTGLSSGSRAGPAWLGHLASGAKQSLPYFTSFCKHQQGRSFLTLN